MRLYCTQPFVNSLLLLRTDCDLFLLIFSLSRSKVCKPVFVSVFCICHYCVRIIKVFAFYCVFQPFRLKPAWRGRVGNRNLVIENKNPILSDPNPFLLCYFQYQHTNTHPHTNTLCDVVSGFLMKLIRRLSFKPDQHNQISSLSHVFSTHGQHKISTLVSILNLNRDVLTGIT